MGGTSDCNLLRGKGREEGGREGGKREAPMGGATAVVSYVDVLLLSG